MVRLLKQKADLKAICGAAKGLYRGRLQDLFEQEGRRAEFKDFVAARDRFRRKGAEDPGEDPRPAEDPGAAAPPTQPPPPLPFPDEASWDCAAKEAVLTIPGGVPLRTKVLAAEFPNKGSGSAVLATFPGGQVAKVIGVWWGLVQPKVSPADDGVVPIRATPGKKLQALRDKRHAIENPPSAEKKAKHREEGEGGRWALVGDSA